jgi:hypothetical protein
MPTAAARGEKKVRKVRTTVSLPKPLYEEAKLAVNSNATLTHSINGFIVDALIAYVELFKRKQIDAKFAPMSEDAKYQKEAKLIAEEFSQSDWETLGEVR